MYCCRPYDTLEEVIGLRSSAAGGSLKEWGVSYAEVPLLADGNVDREGLRTSLQTHSGHPYPLGSFPKCSNLCDAQ